MHQLAQVMTGQGMPVPGLAEEADFEDDAVFKRVNQQLGRELGRCFRLLKPGPSDDPADTVDVDGISVQRRTVTDANYRTIQTYFFDSCKTPLLTPLKPAVDPAKEIADPAIPADGSLIERSLGVVSSPGDVTNRNKSTMGSISGSAGYSGDADPEGWVQI